MLSGGHSNHASPEKSNGSSHKSESDGLSPITKDPTQQAAQEAQVAQMAEALQADQAEQVIRF